MSGRDLARRGLPAAAADHAATAADLAADSLAPNTRRAYAAAVAAFERYLSDLVGEPLPVAEFLAAAKPGQIDQFLALYLGERHAAGRAVSTLRLAVAAVRAVARETRQPDPVGPLTRRVLSGAARNGDGRGRGQAAAIDRDLLDTLLRQCEAETAEPRRKAAAIRDAAILSVMSDGLLRVSEAAALRWRDLRVEPDGSGRLTVARSKTDQTGEGAIQYCGPPTVAAVRRWRRVVGDPSAESPMFRRIHRSGAVQADTLAARSIGDMIRRRAEAAGIEGARGHSLRIGSAVELARRGADLPQLQTAGRWRDPSTPARYVRAESAARGAVAALIYGAAK